MEGKLLEPFKMLGPELVQSGGQELQALQGCSFDLKVLLAVLRESVGICESTCESCPEQRLRGSEAQAALKRLSGKVPPRRMMRPEGLCWTPRKALARHECLDSFAQRIEGKSWSCVEKVGVQTEKANKTGQPAPFQGKEPSRSNKKRACHVHSCALRLTPLNNNKHAGVKSKSARNLGSILLQHIARVWAQHSSNLRRSGSETSSQFRIREPSLLFPRQGWQQICIGSCPTRSDDVIDRVQQTTR